ncbi:MAG TPA: hypothetical protein DIV41_00325 [Ruminococcaceae bacterium]|jgi:hypothetical protein|nr:hypothetical protein [Oscillospiraceae bacterium]
MSKRETRLLALACTAVGIVIGFLISPVKRGISCGNNNVGGSVYRDSAGAYKKHNGGDVKSENTWD